MACSPGTAHKIKRWGTDEESTDRQHRPQPGEAARPPLWSRGAQPAPSLPPAHAFAHACPVEEMAGQGPPRPLWPWHLLQRRPTATCTWLRVAPPGLSQPRHGHRALHGTLRPVGSHAVTRLVLEHRTPQGGNGDSQHRTRNRGLAHQAVLQPWPLLAPRTPTGDHDAHHGRSRPTARGAQPGPPRTSRALWRTAMLSRALGGQFSSDFTPRFILLFHFTSFHFT